MNSRIETKGWGHEEIWADNEFYCGKFLHFNEGSKFSLHFHAKKDETWYVLSGKFELVTLRTADATKHTHILSPGSIVRNKPLEPHQLKCLEKGIIVEVSTADSILDNYRIEKGDSQK